MNFKIVTVLAGIALAASAAPVMAQSYSVYGDGSVKDMGAPAGVPVPAPVPIPVHKADYYIRGDFGIGLSDTMGYSEEGLIYGWDCCGNSVTVPDAWESGDGQLPMTFGIGVGRYWSDRFRTDLTIDWVRQQKGVVEGSMSYTNVDGDDVYVASRDETTKEAGVFLFNAYYDFGTGEHRRFTPYIGAGLGFALNILNRRHETSEEICPGGPCGGIPPAYYEYSAANKSSTITLAAAAMLGFTYDLGHSVLLDMNYRYLHVGGSDIGLEVLGSRSTVSFDAQNEHQLRAGLRFDIN